MKKGYTPAKVLRLSKAQLDGACNDKRYTEEFYIDLIFEECSTAMASKHLLSSSEKATESHVKFAQDNIKANDNVHNEAAARRMGGTISGSESNDAVTITASAYDSMLHRDSRFWDVISERRKQIASGSLEREDGDGDEIENNANSIPFYGTTIGRRREFPEEMKTDKSSTEESFKSNDVSSHRSIQSFSIGGEMDFTVDERSSEPVVNDEDVSPPKEAKKDDLMEALMAIDDDGEDADADRPEEKNAENKTEDDSEEIVFDVNIEDDPDTVALNTNDKDLKEAIVQAHESKDLSGNDEIETNKSKSSCDASLVQIDKLDLDGSDSDQFDFDDGDDDDELQDLEDFLTKSKT